MKADCVCIPSTSTTKSVEGAFVGSDHVASPDSILVVLTALFLGPNFFLYSPAMAVFQRSCKKIDTRRRFRRYRTSDGSGN